jgi:hypothetical protein
MPVVGGRDPDGVEVLSGEELGIAGMCVAAGDGFAGVLESRLIDVADADDPDGGVGGELFEVVGPLLAAADQAHSDALVGGRGPFLAERRAGRADHRARQETPARKLGRHRRCPFLWTNVKGVLRLAELARGFKQKSRLGRVK